MRVVVNTAKPRTPIVRTKGTNALKVREYLQACTNDAYAFARRNNSSYLELTRMLCDILEKNEWICAPLHVITYMKGYMSGAYNSHVARYPDCIPPR